MPIKWTFPAILTALWSINVCNALGEKFFGDTLQVEKSSLLLNKFIADQVSYFNLPKYLPRHLVTKNGILSSVKWCKLRACEKDPASQCNLGNMYYKGFKVKQNYALAFKYYLKAAKGGCGIARDNLATMYEKGHGISPDYATAVNWQLAAVRRGHEKAKEKIKHYVQASSNFAFISQLSADQAFELRDIKTHLTSLSDRYIWYSALCGGGFADNFEEMTYLKNKSEAILVLINNYKKVAQLLTHPTAFINCITLKEYRYYHYFVSPIPNSNTPYLSLKKVTPLREINKNLLPDQLENLYKIVKKNKQNS
jgi:hypothetical protein